MDKADKFRIKEFHSLSADELYAILHARQEVFTIEQGIVYQDLDYIDKQSLHLFLPNDTGKGVKAYLRIIKPGVKYKEASIGRVLTMPDFRGKGYGREIMEEGIKEAVKRFCLPIKIEAQEYLVGFYISLGFRAISAPFILEGISHVEIILSN